MDSKTLDQPPSTTADFATATTRIAVAQITRSTGYRFVQPSALETLTRLAALHLQSLAESAVHSATSSRRTQCNLLDVVHALEHLSSVRGFPGASSLHRRSNPFSSGLLKELRRFVLFESKETPFAKPVPRRISNRSVLPAPTGTDHDQGVMVRGAEIPRWLPGFPEVRKEERPVPRKEAYWEEKAVVMEERGGCGEVKRVEEKGKRVLGWRRERVRFRVRGMVKEEKKNKCGVVGVDLKLMRKRVVWMGQGLGVWA